jgi:hypothetical protein
MFEAQLVRLVLQRRAFMIAKDQNELGLRRRGAHRDAMRGISRPLDLPYLDAGSSFETRRMSMYPECRAYRART